MNEFREKAVSVIHYIFIKYHHMFEIEIISNLVIPILYKVYDEKDMTVQVSERNKTLEYFLFNLFLF